MGSRKEALWALIMWNPRGFGGGLEEGVERLHRPVSAIGMKCDCTEV